MKTIKEHIIEDDEGLCEAEFYKNCQVFVEESLIRNKKHTSFNITFTCRFDELGHQRYDFVHIQQTDKLANKENAS